MKRKLINWIGLTGPAALISYAVLGVHLFNGFGGDNSNVIKTII